MTDLTGPNDRKGPAKYRCGGKTLQAEETAKTKTLREVQLAL